MAVTHLALTTDTTQSAIKSGCTWSTGINRLVWTKPSDTIAGFAFNAQAWRAVFLQRSSIDNHTPNGLGGPQFYSTTRKTPPTDSLWTTLFSTVIGLEGDWPTTFEEVVPHSTFYYYRLIFIAAPDGVSSNGKELDSNVATIVQPFDLSICQQPPACTVPQGCTPRLVWDVPQLYLPFITGSHVAASDPCCGSAPTNGCYKIAADLTQVPNTQTVDVYKSTVGPDSLVKVVTSANLTCAGCGNSCWYDSAAGYHGPIWYQFQAVRTNGSVIPSNIVQLSY